jgi:hypothetical protein
MKSGCEFETILGQVQWFPLPAGADPEDYACRLTAQTGMMWRTKR